MVLISGSYLVCLSMRACSGNLSWQYVNSMNWIVFLGDGDMGVCVLFGTPIMHKMSSHSLAWHRHGVWHCTCSVTPNFKTFPVEDDFL